MLKLFKKLQIMKYSLCFFKNNCNTLKKFEWFLRKLDIWCCDVEDIFAKKKQNETKNATISKSCWWRVNTLEGHIVSNFDEDSTKIVDLRAKKPISHYKIAKSRIFRNFANIAFLKPQIRIQRLKLI